MPRALLGGRGETLERSIPVQVGGERVPLRACRHRAREHHRIHPVGLPFEITSVLILVAILGAVVLAARSTPRREQRVAAASAETSDLQPETAKGDS